MVKKTSPRDTQVRPEGEWEDISSKREVEVMVNPSFRVREDMREKSEIKKNPRGSIRVTIREPRRKVII